MVKKHERIMFSKDTGQNFVKHNGKNTTFRASLRELKTTFAFQFASPSIDCQRHRAVVRAYAGYTQGILRS